VENDYLYIDKTRYLFDLIDRGKVYFMSRPRRFGKSLTISTLYYLFKGEKDLFKDTWIYDKIDWEPRPVIKISMSELDTKDEKTFEDGLKFKLKKLYQLHGLQVQTDNIKYLFSDLIETLGKEKRVVVLIDEYDKPILDHLHEPDKAEAIRERLRTFYSTLKDSDPYLEFVMLTGISKFTGCLLQQTPGNSSSKFQKTGVFSTLNNLDDISIKKRYANMLGYTQEELKVYFHAYTFQNYWVESGSPSFIVEYAKRHDIRVDRIIGEYIRESILTTYEIEAAPPVSFLIQAGYLTFKDRDERKGYLIDYPNKEVRDSFSDLLLVSEFNLKDQVANDIRLNIIDALENRDFEKLFMQM